MADNGIPRVNVPQQSGEYKVVQLDIEGQPYLRFADEGWSTHAVILMTLADKLGKEYPTMEIDRGFLGGGKDDVPALESDWYKVHGMGKSAVDVAQKKVSLFGRSMDYGLSISPEQLESVKPLMPDWSFEFSANRRDDLF